MPVLTAYLLLLICVPATLVVGPLGAAGTPSTLFGIACAAWWIYGRLSRPSSMAKLQPFHLVVGFLLASALCSYVVASLRVADGLEIRSADRNMLKLISQLGVLLITADLIRNRADLDKLLRRITLAGGLLATFGLVQFFFGIEITTYIKIPGLVENAVPQLIQQRSNFRRVSGTTSHPIEFGVTLAMLLPIALHCALTAVHRRHLYVVAVLVIGMAIPTSISRSAMLGLCVAWVALIAGWEARRRANALLITPIALVVMRIAVPGLLGTLRSLFSGLSRDPSILGRTNDYRYVHDFIVAAPWFGRGFGTFIPDLYTTLDNQYLGQLVETGYVGLILLIVFLTSGPVMSWGIKRRANDQWARSIGVSLCAASLVPLVTFATFDGMGFPIVSGFTFLVLGCVAAARHIFPRNTGGPLPESGPAAGRPASH